MTKKFKQHIFSKGFFEKLKMLMVTVSQELDMTRGGGQLSLNYVGEMTPMRAKDDLRKLISHDPQFRQYVE